MENETEALDSEIVQTSDNPKIYSKKAIRGFSFAFTTIFGGVLLRQNLRDVGKKKEGNTVLIFSILFTVLSILIVNIPDKPITSLSFLCNIVGASVLGEYFFKKYFPDPDNYPKKKIWKPLLISIAIIIPFVLAIIYA
jgi:hypothetical protein